MAGDNFAVGPAACRRCAEPDNFSALNNHAADGRVICGQTVLRARQIQRNVHKGRRPAAAPP